jgi:DDE superfamily endonuclease
MPRHRAREFRKCLDEVERNVPANLDIHVVMDNASSHKTKLIRAWFAKSRRWHVHFTPTSSSWINQVERFFALLAEQQIKRGAHRSTAELKSAINAYIKTRNADPKPFRWTKPADDILASVERVCRLTISLHGQTASFWLFWPRHSSRSFERAFLWMFIRSLRGTLKLRNLSFLGSDRMDNL